MKKRWGQKCLLFVLVFLAVFRFSLVASAETGKQLELKKIFENVDITLEKNDTIHYDYAYGVLRILNKERKKQGLEPLKMDKSLLNTADLRVAETVTYFSHVRPDGSSCFTVYEKIGTLGENIAYGQKSPEEVMKAWMNSPGHRKNILNPNFKRVGVGCLYTQGRYYWVQCFSSEASGTPASINDAVANSLYSDVSTKISNVSSVKASSGVKKITVSWSSVKNAKGYKIQIASDNKFAQSKSTTYFVSADKDTRYTINMLLNKKLKSNKRYYVRIRPYRYGKKNGKVVRVYGSWKSVYKTTK